MKNTIPTLFYLALSIFSIVPQIAESATLNYLNPNLTGGIPILTGASDVEVGGRHYNVDFIDGTCEGIWNPCIQTNFTFNTNDKADDAAAALVSQVLIQDSTYGQTYDFSTHREYVRGLATAPAGFSVLIAIPFGMESETRINFALTSNWAIGTPWINGKSLGSMPIDFIGPSFVFAKWTPAPVPIPGAVWLLGSGIAGLLGVRRRRQFH